VAWHLATAFEKVGHQINEIYDRKIEHAEAITNKLYNTEPVDDLYFENSDSEIFILAVSDDQITKVAQELLVPEFSLVLHTSGTQPLDVLMGYDFEPGVLYPLQTLTKGKYIDFLDVPFCIEALETEALSKIQALASTITDRVEVISSEQRRVLHLAAVLANNFTNHLLHLANNILDAEALEFDLLHSLIAETVNKAMDIGPAKAQTGPALRGDVKTMKMHLELLAENPELSNLYEVFSKSIIANK
jgi:predicted short-subunit dehydrogenase-like oxidoreductase (DUF2520 family)